MYRSLNVRETVLCTAVERECTVHPPPAPFTYVLMYLCVTALLCLCGFLFILILLFNYSLIFVGDGFFNGRIINV